MRYRGAEDIFASFLAVSYPYRSSVTAISVGGRTAGPGGAHGYGLALDLVDAKLDDKRKGTYNMPQREQWGGLR